MKSEKSTQSSFVHIIDKEQKPDCNLPERIDILNYTALMTTYTKTKPIRAKHINDVLSDRTIITYLLIKTIEGEQDLRSNSMVCLGIEGEPWQQSSKSLLDKYTVNEINADGWLICLPKAGNSVNAIQVTENILSPKMTDGLSNQFYIFAQWGKDCIIDGENRHIQIGNLGDYICQSPKEPTDIWIVKRSIFENTYEKVSCSDIKLV